jgi:hypothetical protein
MNQIKITAKDQLHFLERNLYTNQLNICILALEKEWHFPGLNQGLVSCRTKEQQH